MAKNKNINTEKRQHFIVFQVLRLALAVLSGWLLGTFVVVLITAFLMRVLRVQYPRCFAFATSDYFPRCENAFWSIELVMIYILAICILVGLFTFKVLRRISYAR